MSRIGQKIRISALRRAADDAKGNADGISGNEHRPEGTAPLFERQPLLARTKAAFRSLTSTQEDTRRLERLIAGFGESLTTLQHPLAQDFLFQAEKAIALTRFKRDAFDVEDFFVKARGQVAGRDIDPREVFCQHWKPKGTPTGTVVVLSPGFLQSGRSFHEQIQRLNEAGHDVIVMDHQWAGHTIGGSAGGIDSGFGIARDVAAVTAEAAQRAQALYPDANRVVIVGTSMGGGPGALGALVLNEADQIQLEGPAMPRDVSAVLQAAYFEKTPSVLNSMLAALGRVRYARDLALAPLGVPVLSRFASVKAKFSQHALTEDLKAKPQAFGASDEAVATIKSLLEAGHRPQGRVYFLHGREDPLAKPGAAREFHGLLGDRAHFHELPIEDHIFEERSDQNAHVLEGIDWVTSGR